jgi:peptide/nickel transport system substrate-binding protein
LKVGFFRAETSPDGYQAQGTFDRMYFYTGMEPLVAIGKDSQYDAAESLAYSFEALSSGLVMRFRLRKGVQFHGGFGEMTADDVVFSLGRWKQPAGAGCSGCPDTFKAVSIAVAVDPYTVDVAMSSPDANLVPKMFDREAIIHSRKNWDQIGGADAHKSKPIGTGPYSLVEWKPGLSTKWAAHPQWWRGKPYADSVEVLIIPETKTRLAALVTGQLNVSWLQAEMVGQARKDTNIKVWDFTGVGYDGWAWNNGLPPLDDLRMRQAMVKAVDRKALNQAVYLGVLRDSNSHVFPPESPFGVDLKDIWEGDLKYDPPAAKKLVEAVAKDRGLAMPVVITGGCERAPERQQFCEFLQGAWSAIGVKFDFQVLTNNAQVSALMDKCATHVHQTGSGILLPHFLVSSLDTRASNRPVGICKDKGSGLSADNQKVQDQLDSLFAKANLEFDDVKRADLYKQAQRLALQQVWGFVPAMLRVNYVGCYAPSTGGCDSNPARGDGFVRNGDFWLKK